MKYFAIHLGIGFVLLLQAFVRSKGACNALRKNTLETLTLWVGALLLWPIILAGELREWWQNRGHEP